MVHLKRQESKKEHGSGCKHARLLSSCPQSFILHHILLSLTCQCPHTHYCQTPASTLLVFDCCAFKHRGKNRAETVSAPRMTDHTPSLRLARYYWALPSCRVCVRSVNSLPAAKVCSRPDCVGGHGMCRVWETYCPGNSSEPVVYASPSSSWFGVLRATVHSCYRWHSLHPIIPVNNSLHSGFDESELPQGP